MPWRAKRRSRLYSPRVGRLVASLRLGSPVGVTKPASGQGRTAVQCALGAAFAATQVWLPWLRGAHPVVFYSLFWVSR